MRFRLSYTVSAEDLATNVAWLTENDSTPLVELIPDDVATPSGGNDVAADPPPPTDHWTNRTCPRCGALPGDSCVSPSGASYYTSFWHSAR